jgi:hypothetical protein
MLICLIVGIVVGVAVAENRELSPPNQGSAVSAFSQRPLPDVIRELEERHGWIITYEDPIYESPNDVEEVTVVRGDGVRGPAIIAPRARFFEFDYRSLDPTRPRELLSSMLSQYHAANDHAFRLVQQGDLFHIIPTSSPDAKGIPTERRSRLDVRVSIEPAWRSVHETLVLILDQVSVSTGESVSLGTSGGLFDRTMVQTGAVNEPARDVLVRTLAATGVKLSWTLLCTARTPRACGFNLHRVQAEE